MELYSSQTKKKLVFLGLICLALLGSVIYFNNLNAPFAYDDRSTITENETVKNLSLSIADITNNRYIGYLSFALNYAAGGLKVTGYHLTNNFIHIINAILVYCFVILISKSTELSLSNFSKQLIAFASAFLFISHPIQTQAVTYIAQRFTSLATMFYLVSIICYLKARFVYEADLRVKGKGNFFSASVLVFYIFSILSAILAMKTKEIAITLPFAIILCELYFFGINNISLRRLSYSLPILLTLLIFPLTYLSFDKSLTDIAEDIDNITRETINISRADYLISQFRVLITYIRLLIFPVNQNLDYDYPVYKTIFSIDIFLSLAVIFLFILTAILSFKKARLISFGIAWFFLVLSVESSFIPIRDVINEHRVYLPSIGFFIASVTVMDKMITIQKIKMAFITVLVLLLSVATFQRNNIWRDPERLWQDVITKAPNNSRAYNNLGVVYKERKEFDKAIEQFEKSLKANRIYSSVYYNLGDVYFRLGTYEKAVPYLRQALAGKVTPQLKKDILNKLGRTYSAMGQTEKAIETLEVAAESFPSSIEILNNLGVQYIKMKRADEAIAIFEKSTKIREEDFLYLNLSVAYAEKGDKEKSNLMLEKALLLKNR